MYNLCNTATNSGSFVVFLKVVSRITYIYTFLHCYISVYTYHVKAIDGLRNELKLPAAAVQIPIGLEGNHGDDVYCKIDDGDNNNDDSDEYADYVYYSNDDDGSIDDDYDNDGYFEKDSYHDHRNDDNDLEGGYAILAYTFIFISIDTYV
jgi:hypothetical protein